MMKTIILIPAYEPDENLIQLIKKLKKENYKVIVVNDGSSEKCNHIFDMIKKDVVLLNHDINKGKGAALKTGFKYIKDNFNDYIIITVDCDGQHKVKDVLNIEKYSLENLDDLILGKRIISKKTPLRSKIGNSITRFIFKIVTKTKVYDTQTGLRAFSYKLIDLMLNIDGDRYEYEMNVLLKSAYNNINIKEIEIETVYFNNNANSHFKSLKDSISIYKQILNFILIRYK